MRVLWLLVFPAITAVIYASGISISPAPFTLSNTVIDVGQMAVANTTVSGGIAPYSGSWVPVAPNAINNYISGSTDVGVGAYWQYTINPGNTLLYAPDVATNDLYAVSLATNSIVNTIALGPAAAPEFAAVSGSGAYVYVTDFGTNSISVINAATNTVSNTIALGSGSDIYNIAINPSANLLYVRNYSYSITVINLTTNTVVNAISIPGKHPLALTFDPYNKLLYAVGNPASNLYAINTTTNSVVNTIPLSSNTNAYGYWLALNQQGTMLYASEEVGGVFNLTAINLQTNTVVNSIQLPGKYSFYPFSINPSGTLAYIATPSQNAISIVDLVTNTVIGSIPAPPTACGTSQSELNPSAALLYAEYGCSPSVMAIANIQGTIMQPLNTIQSGNALMQLSINAASSNTVTISFNGIRYTESTTNNTVYGPWTFYSYVEDSNSLLPDQALYSNTLTINPSLHVLSISTSSSLAVQGDYETLTATWSGGTAPYTAFNWTITNAINGNIIANSLLTGLSSSSDTNTFTFQLPETSNDLGAVDASFSVTDSASSPATNTLATTLTVGQPYITLATTPAAPASIDSGSTITINALVTGGTAPFTYTFYIYNSITDAAINSFTTSSNSFVFTTNTNLDGNTLDANVIMTDNSGYSANSVLTGTFTLNQFPSLISLIPSNVMLDYGQYVNLTATVSGGVPPYTYNFTVVNSVTDSVLSSASTTTSSAFDSATFRLPSSYAGNTIAVNVVVADSEQLAVKSAYSGLGFNASVVAGAITSNSQTIGIGQNTKLTANPYAGTSKGDAVLHSFTGGSSDGSRPSYGTLLQSGSLLYGMAEHGGSSNLGTIFSFNASNSVLTVLHSFSGSQSDGAVPYSITLIKSGSLLYGMTSAGGVDGLGTIFSFNISNSVLTVLHSFPGYAGGSTPFGSLTMSGNILYGAATYGGAYGHGTIFSYNTSNSVFTTLHSFASGSSDGSVDTNYLIKSGNILYGDTFYGGSSNLGTIFSFNISNSVLTVLHSFTGGSDGSTPEGGLVLVGNILYGTGEGYSSIANGVIFSYNTSNSVFSTLHTFSGSFDGSRPQGSLTVLGNVLYGTAPFGGDNGYGTIFSYDTANSTYETVHSFYRTAFGSGPSFRPDGSVAWGSLIQYGNQLYGVTTYGGAANNGVIFSYGTYSYQWYAMPGTAAAQCTPNDAIPGADNSTYTASPSSTYTYAYRVTDRATSRESACSAGYTITVENSTAATEHPCAGGICGSAGSGVYNTSTTVPATSPTTTIPQAKVISSNASSSSFSYGSTISESLPYHINFANTGTFLLISSTSPSSESFNLTITNITSHAPYIPYPGTLILALNITVMPQYLNITQVSSYSCSIPGSTISVYISKNGSWGRTAYTFNATACTVSFFVPAADPIVEILTNYTGPVSTPPTTLPPQPTTLLGTTTAQSKPQPPFNPDIIIAGIVAAIIIVSVLAYLRARK